MYPRYIRFVYIYIYTWNGTICRNYSVAFVVSINMQKCFGQKLLSIENDTVNIGITLSFVILVPYSAKKKRIVIYIK